MKGQTMEDDINTRILTMGIEEEKIKRQWDQQIMSNETENKWYNKELGNYWATSFTAAMLIFCLVLCVIGGTITVAGISVGYSLYESIGGVFMVAGFSSVFLGLFAILTDVIYEYTNEIKTVKDAILHTAFTIILFALVMALIVAICAGVWAILTAIAP